MLKILQTRLQQYMHQELSDVQAGFRTGKRTRGQMTNIHWIIEKAGGFQKDRGTRIKIANIYWIIEKIRKFQKNIYFRFIDYTKAFDCVDHSKLENS